MCLTLLLFCLCFFEADFLYITMAISEPVICQAGLEFMELLPLPPEYWVYASTPG